MSPAAEQRAGVQRCAGGSAVSATATATPSRVTTTRSPAATRDFTPAVQRLGLAGIRSHDLRHTGNALALAAAAASLANVMARMGPTSVDVALR